MTRSVSAIAMLVAAAVVAMVACVGVGAADDGLVAEWHFDEGAGGVLVDSSGNGNDGTIYGAAWTEGVVGGALSFDGVDDYAEVPHDSSLDFGYGDLSISCWIKTTTTEDGFMVLKRGSPGNARWYDIRMGPEVALSVSTGGGNRVDPSSNPVPYNDGNWHHVVGVRNGNTGYMYIDGVLEGSDTDTGLGTSGGGARPLRIANNDGAGGYIPELYFNGVIDEIRIYNRALTADEIREQYGLVAEWHFDEGSGGVLHDSSGNGNNGTIYGATWVDGISRKGLYLDGVNDYIEVPNSLSLGITNAITVEVWINPTTISASQFLICKRVGSRDVYRLSFESDGITKFVTELYPSGSLPVPESSDSVSINEWIYIVATYDGMEKKLYINGVEDDSVSASGSLSVGSGGLYFGCNDK